MTDKFSKSGLPPTVVSLADDLAKFPGIGRKSALRMALHILRSSRDFAQSLSDSLMAVKDRVSFCQTCWTLSEENPCPICTDSNREHNLICVVEEPGDVIAIERTGCWRGVYHVLGGAISPLDGIGPDQLRIDALVERTKKGDITEIVVATNPTPEGETTALYIARIFSNADLKITRIARGVPVGSDLELVDDSTLQQSIEGRGEII